VEQRDGTGAVLATTEIGRINSTQTNQWIHLSGSITLNANTTNVWLQLNSVMYNSNSYSTASDWRGFSDVSPTAGTVSWDNAVFDAQGRVTGYRETVTTKGDDGSGNVIDKTEVRLRDAIVFDAHNRVIGYRDTSHSNEYPGMTTVTEMSVAQARDDQGNLHAVSTVCTHRGCTVGWNSAEKTWDCPCHGSRYDPLGRVIHGPAIVNLARKKVP
jgi:Rieske Fe-S protein